MERYLLFGFDRYYPSGGMNDLIAKFDDVDRLIMILCDFELEIERQYYQILDTENGEIKGFSLYDKIMEYEEIHGDIDFDEEHDVRIKLISEFVTNSIK